MSNNFLKVLVLNPYLPTLGGGEKHMGYLCEFLEKYFESIQIDILVHDYNQIGVFSDDYITIEDVNKQFDLNLNKTRIIKTSLIKSGGKLNSLKNKIKIENMTKNYDIFINFMFLSKHIGKAKFNIYECMFPAKPYYLELNGIKNKIFGKIMDIMFFRSYDYFISNSCFTNHWLSTYWKISEKNKIIYPPVFWKKEIAGRYDENKKKNIIISVGRFFVSSHSKKQLELVKFFVNNQDVLSSYEYHLVGAVSNAKQDIEYVNQIKELANTVDNVFIHENCPYNELIDLYTKAKIFWHGTGYLVDENVEPEKMEHFGITTVEAMSFGVVPVVINKGGQKETVISDENGYLWNNEKECIECTKKLIENDEKRRKMAKISAERANLYSIDEFFEANRRIFDERRF